MSNPLSTEEKNAIALIKNYKSYLVKHPNHKTNLNFLKDSSEFDILCNPSDLKVDTDTNQVFITTKGKKGAETRIYKSEFDSKKVGIFYNLDFNKKQLEDILVKEKRIQSEKEEKNVETAKSSKQIEEEQKPKEFVTYRTDGDFRVKEIDGIEFYDSNIVDYEEMKTRFHDVFQKTYPNASIDHFGVWLNLSATSKEGKLRFCIGKGQYAVLSEMTKALGIGNFVKEANNKSLKREIFTIARLQRCFAPETSDFLKKLYNSEKPEAIEQAKSIVKIRNLKWFGFPTAGYMDGLRIQDLAMIAVEIVKWEDSWILKKKTGENDTDQNNKRFSENYINFLKLNKKVDIDKLEKYMEKYLEIEKIDKGFYYLNEAIKYSNFKRNGFYSKLQIMGEIDNDELNKDIEKYNQSKFEEAEKENKSKYLNYKLGDSGALIEISIDRKNEESDDYGDLFEY